MKKHYLLIALFFLGLIISGIRPHDYFKASASVRSFKATKGMAIQIENYNIAI